jgi:putative membrane protein
VQLPSGAGAMIAAAVEEAESQTSVEIVVAGRASSGSYLDLALAAGASTGFGFLAFALFTDLIVFPEWVVLAGVVALAAGGALSLYAFPPLCRLLAGSSRLAAQVRDAGRLLYLKNGVDRTRGRTGLLIYVSFFERRCELIADHAVVQAAGAELERLRVEVEAVVRAPQARFLDELCAAIRGLGSALADRLPREEDDIDELANALDLGAGEGS